MDATLTPPAAPDAAVSPRDAAASRPAPSRAFLAAALLVLAAFAIYSPWTKAPFSALDFSEFIPVLRRAGGLVQGTAALAAYYAGHGRSALVTYAWIALNWSLFGDWATGWDLLRAALMSGAALAGYGLLRRLGCSPAGAAAGAALLVVATPAQSAWTRLTGEPLGLLALIGAAWLALGYQGARRWLPRACALAALLWLAVMAKEILVVCALPVALLAVCWRGGALHRPRRLFTRRNLVLAGVVGVAMLAAAAIVITTLRGTRADGYAQSYGAGSTGVGSIASNLALFLLPLTFTLTAPARIAALLLGLTTVAGWAILLRERRHRGARIAGFALALGVPVLGAGIYLPWPRLEPFYAYPFLVGNAALLGIAATALQRRVRSPLVFLPVLFAAALGAADAGMHSDIVLAKRIVNGALAQALSQLPAGDTVYVTLPAAALSEQRWQGPGPTLRRFAIATRVAGAGAPPVADLSCEEAFARWQRAPRSITLITYADYCGGLPGPVLATTAPVRYLDLLSLRRVESTYRAELWMPSLADTPAPAR